MNYNTKDALGDEIVIGATYGYSGSVSGVTIIKIGQALYFSDKGMLTLKVLSHKRAVSVDTAMEQEKGRNIRVKAASLFPVNLK